jgi:hypothetical protein
MGIVSSAVLRNEAMWADFGVGLNDQSQEQDPGWEEAKLEERVSGMRDALFNC